MGEPCPPRIEAEVVGGFAVRVDGRDAGEWPRPPARRLVQLLLLEPRHRMLRTEAVRELAGSEAGGEADEQARRALSKALSQARQVLGQSAILADGPHLLLAGEVHLDLDGIVDGLRAALEGPAGPDRQARLEQALGRCDPVLPGEPETGALARARRRLAELRRAARLALAEESGAAGSLEGWEAAFDADPADEEVAVGLISACRRLGADARAVQVHRAARQALVRTYGRGAFPALDAAVEGIREGSAGEPARPRLHGRDRELAEVLAALRDAEDGAGIAICVTGPAGIGKSTLLARAVAMLEERGWKTVAAAAGAEDYLVPYAAVRGLLTRLQGAVPGEAPRLAPSIGALLRPRDDLPEARWPMPVLVADLARLFDDLAARQPLLLVIDDVHRSDPATHELLDSLARTGAECSWSILTAARNDDKEGAPPPFGEAVRTFQLCSLDPSSASALAREHLERGGVEKARQDELAALVAGWSLGNPLFIVELARQAAAGGEITRRRVSTVPARIVELFEQRLASCSEDARATLPLVALAHPNADYALVAELVMGLGAGRGLSGGGGPDGGPGGVPGARPGASREGAAKVVDELLEAAVVVRTDTGIRLAHPLWREAALSRVNPLRLANLHSRIADALDEVGGRELVSAGHRIAAFRSAQLVEHAEAAATAGLAAGHASRSVMAHDVALQLYEAALAAFEALPAKRGVRLRAAAHRGWLEKGHIRADRLDLGAARDSYERALGLAATDDEYAAGYSALGGIAYKRGEFAEAEAIYGRGLRMLAGSSAWALARLETDIAWSFHRRGDRARSLAGLRRAAALFASTTDRAATASCLDLLAIALASAGEVDEALATSDKALALADRCHDISLVPTLAAHRARLLLTAGRAAEAEARRAGEAARRAGDRYVESVSLWVLADCLDASGDLGGALAALADEEKVLLALGNEANRSRCLAHQAAIHSKLGMDARARELAAEAERAAMSARREHPGNTGPLP